MKTRFTGNSTGVHLVAGILVFAAMTLLLGEISEDVINHEPLTVADAQLSNWLHTHRSPYLTTFLWAVTSLHSTLPVSCYALVFGIFLMRQRKRYWVAAVWISVFGGMLLNKLLKYAFHRARPHFDDPILTLTSYSFPSGHTMMATVMYGVLAVYLLSRVRSMRRKTFVILLAGSLIALVGFSRIYLGAHYLSDVLGATAEGIAWLSLSLTAVYYLWQRMGEGPQEA